MSVHFRKYSALGNEYLVLLDSDFRQRLNASNVRHLCDPTQGTGADGILATADSSGGVGVQIWNADGSLAEKSGNGLRIFSRFLWDQRQIGSEPVSIETAGGHVEAQVLQNGATVRVKLGQVTFPGNSEESSIRVRVRDVEIQGIKASVGNPHCVCLVDSPTATMARSLGPVIENLPAFPQRTNVQFVKVISRGEIQLEVWERGSGYTLSSGTSASAAVAVCRRIRLVDQAVAVVMPGGTLAVSVDDEYFATIEGPVQSLGEFDFPESLFA